MFVAFIPFFSILLPMKIEAVAPQSRVALLGWITVVGAIAASIANIAFGALSDRTHAARGTRRPWIAAGLGLTMIGYALIYRAQTAAGLTGAILFFQCALNLLFAPLGAVLADEVPDSAKGLAAALLGIAHPFASFVGVLVLTPLLPGEAARFGTICAGAAALILPFLLFARERQLGGHAQQTAGRPPPPRRDFALAWAARFAVQIAGTAIMTYLYFYFQAVLGGPGGEDVGEAVAMTIAWGTAAAVLLTILAGRLSDRLARRKPFIGLSGAGMAVGLCIMAGADGWWVAACGYWLFVSGYSVFIAVHSAFAVQLLPSSRHRGRDLGILNLTNTVPSVIGPMLAMLLLGEAGGGFTPLLLALALVAALGAGGALLVNSRS